MPDLPVSEQSKESPVQVLVALAEEADAEIPDTSADAEIPGCTNAKSPIPIIIEYSSSNSPVFDGAPLS